MRNLVLVQRSEAPGNADSEACGVPPYAGEGGRGGAAAASAFAAGRNGGGPVEESKEAAVVAVLEDDGTGLRGVGDEADKMGVVG